jgi:hypothetical protein
MNVYCGFSFEVTATGEKREGEDCAYERKSIKKTFFGRIKSMVDKQLPVSLSRALTTHEGTERWKIECLSHIIT